MLRASFCQALSSRDWRKERLAASAPAPGCQVFPQETRTHAQRSEHGENRRGQHLTPRLPSFLPSLKAWYKASAAGCTGVAPSPALVSWLCLRLRALGRGERGKAPKAQPPLRGASRKGGGGQTPLGKTAQKLGPVRWIVLGTLGNPSKIYIIQQSATISHS